MQKANKISLEVLKGQKILPYLDNLAELRIQIFKEYPYLYLGNYEYERNYLKTYANCSESIVIIVKDESEVIGASTAIPMEFEADEFQAPFLKLNYDIKKIFYFGESLLLPEYRGLGIYKNFFKLREEAAKDYGSTIATFAAIARDNNDSRKPQNYQPLDPYWKKMGYRRHDDISTYFSWQEIGEDTSSPKLMKFWLKMLDVNA